MKLDTTFIREIKAANGDGSREARFKFLATARVAASALSTPAVMTTFNDAVREHGRVAVAACVAATVLDRCDRLDPATVDWAKEVMHLWTNRTADLHGVTINDNLHPTRIEEYAGGFIRLTTGEECA